MLKMMKRRKVALGITVVLILALAAGATYAWFTSNSTTERLSAELGTLKIEGVFETDIDDFLYQPGDTIEVEGTLKNSGTLGLIAKVSMDPVTTIRSDSDGNPLANNGSYLIENDPNVLVKFGEGVLASKMMEDGSVIAWFEHKSKPGEYYVVMDVGTAEEVAFEAEMSGSGIGNHYMRATVSFGNGVFATQTRTGATMEAWGIDWEQDLEMLPLQEGRSRSLSDRNQMVRDRVAELFNQ